MPCLQTERDLPEPQDIAVAAASFLGAPSPGSGRVQGFQASVFGMTPAT